MQTGQSGEQDSFSFILQLSLYSGKILMWREQLLFMEDCFEAKRSITFSSFQSREIEHPVQCLCRDEVLSGEDGASVSLQWGLPGPWTIISPHPFFFYMVSRDGLLFSQAFAFLEIWLILEAVRNYVWKLHLFTSPWLSLLERKCSWVASIGSRTC